MRATIVSVICICALLAADYLYFAAQRDAFDGGSINEAFLRKGTLGKLLRNADLLTISADSSDLAVLDMCATDGELKGFDFHDTLRLRLRLVSKSERELQVSIEMPDAKNKKYLAQKRHILVVPGRDYYALNFHGEADTPINISLTSVPPIGKVVTREILLDGRFGRTQPLILGDSILTGMLLNAENKPQESALAIKAELSLTAANQQLLLAVPEGISENLFEGVFPGKKITGYCRYQANLPSKTNTISTDFRIPSVNLSVAQEHLSGPDGILQNKEIKGRQAEVPASISTRSSIRTYQQAVGLRFHGGGPGRLKDVNSFRIYARNDYGNGSIPHHAIFRNKRGVDLKTVVFKYTYQAYFDQLRNDFNPFNHALALDIANEIGALVPSHGLVQLSINGKAEGIFLAMEHLSDRTIKNWLGHDNFVSITYKKENSYEAKSIISAPLLEIKNAQGEKALEKLEQHYDVDNVINSIILSAYIADDDFCQGTEFMDTRNQQITSINWDLDHAFLFWVEHHGLLEVNANRPGYRLLSPNQSTDVCTRSRVYSWVYSQSNRFRQLFRKRLNYLLNNQLSAENVVKMIDYYRSVNKHYYAGQQDNAIKDLERFAHQRPPILDVRLQQLEDKYSAISNQQ